jgi:hypothetical protein
VTCRGRVSSGEVDSMVDSGDHGQYVKKVSEQFRRYGHELLEENRKLRALVASLEAEGMRVREELAVGQTLADLNAELRDKLRVRDEEKQHLEDQLRSARRILETKTRDEARLKRELNVVDEDNRRFTEKFLSLEQQNSNLANLYVAGYRLHGTLDRREVIGTLQEIIANLVGSEEMALFELEPGGRRLSLLASFGIQPEAYQVVPVGEGVIGRAAESGEIFVAGHGAAPEAAPGEEGLTACIPLKLEGRVTGLVAIFRLLPQKRRIEDLDRELFDLLASHAAPALYCAELHARAQACSAV